MYKIGDIEVMALQGLDLAVEKGEMLAIIGNSGSGKSTLMNIIGGLDRPTAGKIHVNGTDLLKLSDKEMMHYMRETIGFVWQNTARNMIPYLNALDNVKLVMQMAGKLDVNRANMLLETGWPIGRKIKCTSSPAVSSSVSQLQSRLPILRKYCLLMSRPVR